MAKTVTVLGLGRMGGLMAKHLATDGYTVSGYDPAAKAVSAAKRNGVKTAKTVASAVKGAEVVCSSLPSPAVIRDVYLGTGGALEAMARGTVCFELSTGSVALVREIAAAAQKKGIAFLDTPVSGSVPHLERRELAAMAAGDRKALNRRRDILDTFCKSVTYMGAVGNALIMKLVTNHILNIHHAGIAEGLAFGVRAGLGAKQMVDFLQKSVIPQLLNYKAPAMAARTYTPVIADVGLSKKDLGLSIDAAAAAGAPVPLGAVARQQYISAEALGFGKADFNAVYEAYMSAMGVKPKKPA